MTADKGMSNRQKSAVKISQPSDNCGYWQYLLSPWQKFLLSVAVCYPHLLNNSAFAEDLTVLGCVLKGTSVNSGTIQYVTYKQPTNQRMKAKITNQPMHKILCNIYNNNNNTHLMALCPGLPRWASTRKVKSIWILLPQETVGSSGISWTICKSAPRPRQILMPVPHHSIFYRPDALSVTQPTASKHWRQLMQHLQLNSWIQCWHLGNVCRSTTLKDDMQWFFGC